MNWAAEHCASSAGVMFALEDCITAVRAAVGFAGRSSERAAVEGGGVAGYDWTSGEAA